MPALWNPLFAPLSHDYDTVFKEEGYILSSVGIPIRARTLAITF